MKTILWEYWDHIKSKKKKSGLFGFKVLNAKEYIFKEIMTEKFPDHGRYNIQI